MSKAGDDAADPSSVAQIGVISDTHGLLRPEALNALRGCELILHAGDVGRPEVLARLREIAPVIAVKGNVDRAEWARELPAREVVEIRGHRIYIVHDLSALDLDPVTAGVTLVVSGHTHKPSVERREGIMFLNPGSAGPRRFTLPTTLARLSVTSTDVQAALIDLLQAS